RVLPPNPRCDKILEGCKRLEGVKCELEVQTHYPRRSSTLLCKPPTVDAIFGGRSSCVPARSCCPPQRNDPVLVRLHVAMARSQYRPFLDQACSRLRRDAIFWLTTNQHAVQAKSTVNARSFSFLCGHFDATNMQVSLWKRNFDPGFSQGLGDCDRYIALKLKPCVLPSRPEAQLKVQ